MTIQNVRSGVVANTTRVAVSDTWAEEDVGGGVTVRRLVTSGDPIPDHYEVADDAAFQDATTENIDPTFGS